LLNLIHVSDSASVKEPLPRSSKAKSSRLHNPFQVNLEVTSPRFDHIGAIRGPKCCRKATFCRSPGMDAAVDRPFPPS
jgi:hypothetical protein